MHDLSVIGRMKPPVPQFPVSILKILWRNTNPMSKLAR